MNNSDQQRISPPMIDSSPLTMESMDKNRESLKIKLMVRRSPNQLVQQGILPDLKTSPAIHEQRQKLERAKTGDLLKAKIQQRPNREELERRHILESHEGHIDPSLADKYRMLEKAILVDQLNSKISHRPGPLELIEKNILHTKEPIERIVKEGLVEYKLLSVDDSVVFEDDSQSSEGDPQSKSETILLTTSNFIEQPSTSNSSSNTALLNGNVIKLNLAMPCTSAAVIPKLTIKLPTNDSSSTTTTSSFGQMPDTFISNPPPPPLIINTKLTKEIPALEPIKPTTSFLTENNNNNNNNNNNSSNIKSHISSFIQNNQKLSGSSKDKNRKKCKIKPSIKSKAIKFHEYKGPPNANKTSSSSQATLNNKKFGENNYSLIMQQQCLLEYLEGIYKNPQQQQQHQQQQKYEDSCGNDNASEKINNSNDVIKKEDTKKAFVTIFPSKAPTNTSTSTSSSSAINGVINTKDSVISDVSQLSKLKVSELKAFLKKFSMPVSGPKPLLVERLKSFLPLKMSDSNSTEINNDDMVKCKESPMQSPASAPMLIDAESNLDNNNSGEDIVKEQQRKIEELERKLQESQQEIKQMKQIKHSDSFSSLPGGTVNTEEPFFHIIPTNSNDLQNNLLYDQKYQIASPISTVFVVTQPSIVLAPDPNLPSLLLQTDDNAANNSIIDSLPPSVMMINDDDENSRHGNQSENEVSSNDEKNNLPFNIIQDEISDVLDILLKNEKWPNSPSSHSKEMENEEQSQPPVLQSNVLSSTFIDPPSMNEPMSPLLANDASSVKSPLKITPTNVDDCNSNYVSCPMDVDDNTNMLIDSSSFTSNPGGIKKSPIHLLNSTINNIHKDDDIGGSGGVRNSLIGNFDNNLFDTFKNNINNNSNNNNNGNNNNNNNNLLNPSSFYNCTNNMSNSHNKESERNYMNNLNILNNFEIFGNMEVPMEFEPYDIYHPDTFFNNINHTLQNSSHERECFLNNPSGTYFNSAANEANDIFSEVDLLESVTEKV